MKDLNGWWVPDHANNVCTDALANGTQWDHELLPYFAQALRAAHPDAIALDIGASYGLLTRELASLFPLVVAFEPQPAAFECLVANTAEVREKVVCLQAAAYDRPTWMLVAHEHDQKAPGCADEPGHPSSMLVPSTVPRHDGMVALVPDHLPPCRLGLIKADAQGADLRVLYGCGALIQEWRPWVIFEHEDGLCQVHGYEKHDVDQWLEGHRYEVVAHPGTNIVARPS
jgi:FkbM family methyltransferase